MTKVIHYIWWLGILCWSLSACSDDKLLNEKGLVEVRLSLNTDMSTRTSSDIGVATHSVDRILVLPFQKVNLSLPDTQNDNFIPVWPLARQYNIPVFPSTNLSFTLENSKTYKILVIGYNHADYDHNTPSGSGNRVILSSQPLPTTLENFQLSDYFTLSVHYADTTGEAHYEDTSNYLIVETESAWYLIEIGPNSVIEKILEEGQITSRDDVLVYEISEDAYSELANLFDKTT